MTNPKLTPVQVAEIRRLHWEGVLTIAEIARKYNIDISTASRAVRGLTWGPLEAR